MMQKPVTVKTRPEPTVPAHSKLPYLSIMPVGDGKYKVVACTLRDGKVIDIQDMCEPLTAEFAARKARLLFGQLVYRPAINGQGR